MESLTVLWKTLQLSLLSLIEHKITYLDHFLGAIEGSVFITSYKMYFRSDPDPDNPVNNIYIYYIMTAGFMMLYINVYVR